LNPNPSEITFAPQGTDVKSAELIISIAYTEENMQIVLKRFLLALMALRVPESNLDKTLELNFQLQSFPSDGFDELLETTSEIRDFYRYVNDESTARTQTEIVSGKITHSFVRPEFPIHPDDME
jgi:hypothetical protein